MRTPSPALSSADDAAVRRVISEARRNGIDTVEALHRTGYLLTSGRRQVIAVETLQALLRNMETWTPTEYVRRVTKTAAPTPKQMYDAILGYLAEYVEKETRGG